MTVLRSREIVSTIKPQSHFETLEIGVVEPVTPAKTLEPSNHAVHSTPSSIDSIPSPGTVGSGFRSVTETRRRSLRLVMRKRKSENEDGLERVGGDRVGVVETGVSDSRVRKIRVLDRIRVKNGVLGELGLGMEGEEEVGSGERELDLSECVSPSNLRSSMDVSRRETSDGSAEKGKRKLSNGVDLSSSELVMENLSGEGFLKLRSGKKITKRKMQENSGLVGFVGFESNGGDNSVRVCGGRDREKINELVLNGGITKGLVMNKADCDLVVDEVSGSLMIKGVDKVEKIELDFDCKVDISAGNAISDAVHLSGKVGLKELDKGQIRVKTCTGVYARRRLSRDGKGKGKVVEDVLLSKGKAVLDTAHLPEKVSLKELEKEQMTDLTRGVKAGRRLTREEKGKSKVADDDFLLSGIDVAKLRLEPKVENSPKKTVSKTLVLEDDVLVQAERNAVGVDKKKNVNRERGYKDRFRDIARQNASRFAHFSSQEVEENSVNDVAESEMPRREADGEMEEDWPGPFSTAMRIIKDREMNVNSSQQIFCLEKGKAASLKWVPKKNQHCDCSKQSIPLLKDLCMAILAKNADAITSLVSVPDVLRHKLSQLLCDSRRMNSHFLDLLVHGSPMEIRIRDCSWLTEEQFTRSFQDCEASNLMVLQLDQCGRCMPDYVLSTTLARLPNSLPVLTSLSLKGACRLSDVGLNALVASAPALRSINLSQCSLLTSDGIKSLAASLESVLRELYLDDCQTIDAMLVLPALLKLEHLEVLSLAGIQTVCDAFVSKLVAVRGHNFKELVLTDCMKLTDSSLKVIAETCTGLCALDLCNLCKLTDSTMGYLANGCRAIQTLKLCRNSFSDEAVAAYLEASGESLKELSLNNVNKVGHNTAISIARCSRNLFSLDISWCRNLTNEALGLIVDSCLSLKVLKLFGCTQITNIFLDGHSNPQVQIIGLKMTPILKHLKEPDPLEGPLHYSSVSS